MSQIGFSVKSRRAKVEEAFDIDDEEVPVLESRNTHDMIEETSRIAK